MEISTLKSKNNLDFTSFPEKDRYESSNAEYNILGMNGESLLIKTNDDSEQSDNIYVKQKENLDAVLGMSLAKKEVSGMLEGVMESSTLDVHKQVLEDINENVKEKVQEARDNKKTAREQTLKDQIAADAEAQAVTDAESKVDIETKKQDKTKEKPARTNGTSEAQMVNLSNQVVSRYV